MIDMIRKRRLPVIRNDASQLPIIHLEDAVSATLRALDIAPAGSIYDIVDDQSVSLSEIVEAIAEYTNSAKPFKVPAWLPRLVSPYMARMTSVRLPLSNAKAKTELGWQPNTRRCGRDWRKCFIRRHDVGMALSRIGEWTSTRFFSTESVCRIRPGTR